LFENILYSGTREDVQNNNTAFHDIIETIKRKPMTRNELKKELSGDFRHF